MRRIIHNTTAVAACLSLLAPQLAMAELSLPKGVDGASAHPLVLAQAETGSLETDADGNPLPLPEGEAADADSEPQDGSEPSAAETDPAEDAAEDEAAISDLEAALAAENAGGEQDAPAEEMTPADSAAEGQSEESVEAEAPADAAEAEADAAPEAEAAESDAQAEAEAEAQPDAEAEAEAQPATQAEPEPEAQADTESQVAAETELPETPVEEAPADLADEAADATQAEAEMTATPQSEGAEADAAALAEALRAENERQMEAEPAPDAESAAEPADADADAEASAEAAATGAASDVVSLAQGNVQQTRAREMPRMARVLEEEVAAGLTLGSLTCLTGGSFPCADGDRAMTPRGIVVESNGAGAFRLAPTSVQMYRVTQSGEMVQRAAEEDTRETEAAREAAQASEPVNAAALQAEEGSGEVTEQQVTTESARSSSEDFATSLRDALSAAGGQTQQPAASGSGGGNDLTRALLLGLGAVAVGSMLNNNRQVALSAPDRVVVTRPDGSQEVIKDEVALLRQPGSTVTTENFDDGSSRTIVTRDDGSRIVTIRDADLRVLRRTLVSADGTTTQLIDDTADVQPVDVAQLPAAAPVQSGNAPLDEDALRAALQREANVDRRFTLSQIRNIPEVRALVAPVNIDAITFDTGSAAIRPEQARQLQSLGQVIQDSIRTNPREIFMIEGHTDTVGSDAYNLALSDRRAESVALALTEYFDVPPENLVTQGYGEQFLRIRAEGDIRENRRASVRRITDLLAQ